jgi:hypothetical protein
MGKWLLLAALALPAAARAEPLKLPDPAITPPPAPGWTDTVPYAPTQPADPMARYAGWGMRATIQGRSMDLGSLSAGWSADPAAGPRDIEAGYGWRRGGTDALVGYGQYDAGPKRDFAGADKLFQTYRPRDATGGVLGISLVLHGR